MKTSHFTGGKVTEPKVKSYGGRPLHVDMESYKKSVLSDAWSSYDDTKSTFHHVNTKEHGKETHSSDHYPQSSINHRPVTNQRLTYHHSSTETRPIINEPILNGRATRPTNNISYSHSWENTTVHPPELISSVYRGPSPSTRDLPIDTSQLLSSVYRGTSNRSTPRSNTSSYRGPSPKATPTTHIDTSQGLSYRGSSLKDTPSTGVYKQQYRDESNHTHSVKPMTRKTRSASGRTDTRVRVGMEPKLKLPQETISTLHETIERQKRELDELAYKKHKQQQRFNAYTSPTTNQYTSNNIIPVTTNHQPAPIKRRKIATAPPPKSYAGFTSTLNGPPTLRPKQRQHVPLPPTSNNEQTEPPKFGLPRPPLITPSSWRSGQENVDRIIGKRIPLSKSLPTNNKPRLPTVVGGHLPQRSSNISMLLQELDGDDTSDGDVNCDDDDDFVSSDSSDNGVIEERRVRPSNVAMKLRKILDSNKDGESNTANTVVEKHYDRNAVRKYMKCKEEEKRRKIKEERETQQRAQEERERRLKDLQDRQHQILISNLLHQKRQKSDNPTTSDHYYTSHETNYYNSYTSPLLRPLSPPVISPQHTPISPTVSQYTTPIRYTTTNNPRININFTTPPHSHTPVSHAHTPVPHSHTPVPHAHTPVSHSHTPVSHAHTPVSYVHTPIPHSHTPVPHGYTPVSHVHTPVSYVHTSVPHSHTPVSHSHTPVSYVHTPVPHSHTPYSNTPINTSVPHYYTSPVYLSTSIHTNTLSSSVSSSSVTPPYSPSKGPISSSISSPQGSPRRTPISDHHQARILALKQSAIALREKIIAQRHVMTDKGIYSPKRVTTSKLTGTTSHVLPGISNIHQHASSVLLNQQQDSAATIIQSVWKGYKERKNMLNKPVEPVRPVTSPFVLPCTVQTTPYIEITPPITRPPVDVLHVQSPPVLKTTMSLKQASPWLQECGDRFSVVNIYTRRQEQLKKLLEECPVVTANPLIVTSVGVNPIVSTRECPPLDVSTVTESDDSSMETNSIIMENNIGQDEVDQEHVTIPSTQQDVTSSHQDVTSVQQDVTNVQQDVSSAQQQDITSTQQDVTSTQQDVTSSQEDDPSSPSAITPPGSSSFNESFTTPPLYNPMTQPTSDVITSPRRFSPHSLEVKLRAELNVLEAVGEGVRQLEGVESTRVVSLAQQETVALANLMKSQRQSNIITNQTESEHNMREFQKLSEEANKMSERLKEFEYRSKQEAEMHTQQIKKIQEVSCQKVNDITEQLLTNQSAVTTTIIDITEKQLQSAHDMAVGVAKTAAQEAVISALKQNRPTSTTISYKSDFEESIHYEHSSAATLTPTSLAPSINNKLSPQLSGGRSTRSQSLTPVPSERSNHGDEEDHTITEGTISEEEDETILTGEEGFSTTGEISEEISHIVEDDDDDDRISETSFRELLPSESHRRKHKRNISSKHSNDSNDSIQQQQQHLLLSGDTSPISGGGDESFLDFMSRMLHQYTKEEEMRAKHQATLLELREKAIKEKTDAQLKWLKIKKGQVQKRGDDLAMPPLLKRERGILKQLQHEQAEIQRLKEVHRAASNERRLFLLQQQDISRINRSAHYYKDKIRKYGSHNSREQSPYMDISPSPSPSIYMSQEDIHYSLSSLNTSPNKSLSQSTTSIPDMISQSPETTPISLPNQTIPVLKSSTIDHDTIKLRQKTAQDAERLLNKRTEQLIMKRKKAEDLLRTEQEILQRKMELDKEEERIALIIEQANECRQQIEIKTTNLSPNQTSPLSPVTTPLSLVTTPTTIPITSIHDPLSSTMNISNYGTSSFDTDNNNSSLTNDIITTPITNDVITTPTINEILDNESCQIDQLKTQLKMKEQKIKKDNILKENQQQQTFNYSSSSASLPKTELTASIKDNSTNDTDQTTPTDFNIDLLSPISSGGISSSSSASTVISTAINSSKDNSNNESIVLINNMGVASSSEDEISENLEQESGQSGVLSPIPVEQESGQSGVLSPIPVEEQESGQSGMLSLIPVEEQESGQSGVLSPIPVEQVSGQSGVLSPIPVEQVSGQSGVLSPIPVEQVSGQFGVLSPIPVEEQESGQSGVLSPIPVEEQESNSAQPSVLSPIPVEQKLGQSSAEAEKEISLSEKIPIPTGQHAGGVSGDLTIGRRVLVGNKIQGTIQYIGETEFNKGIWIGVELDYEKGKNDGSVNGKRYFTCSPKYGLFAPPTKVVPLESEMSSDSEDSNHGNHSEDSNHGNHSEASDNGNHSKENDKEIINELLSNSNNDTVSESNGMIEDVVSHSSERSAKHILAIKKNVNIPVDNVTEELLCQLTSEAFGTVHNIWKTKDMSIKTLEKIDEVTTEATIEEIDQQQLVDNITDDLLNALVTTEVNVMCNIQSVKSSEHETKCDNTVNRERASFSSEPLSLVPCTRETINDITLVAWNAVMNNTVVPNSPPSDMIRYHCTMSLGPMLDCQISFVKFVYQLAMEVIHDSKSNCKQDSTKRLASFFHKKPFTLELVQSKVYTLVQQSKKPTKLLPPRYLAGNCRPAGGKIVDGVDLLLIKELRDEEPSWVNYDKDEEEVKMRTADEIFDLLLDETVVVLNGIYRKKTLT